MPKNTVVSIAEASRLFDDRYFNPNATKDVFGFHPELPPISFTPDVLESHSEKGHLLVCYHDIVDGRPFRLKEMAERALSGGRNMTVPEDPFLLTKAQFDPDGNIHDTPYILPNDPTIFNGTVQPGWQLVSADIVPETRNTHAIQLIDKLVDYVAAECFGHDIPAGSLFGTALSRWNPEKGRCEGACEYPCGSANMGAEWGVACDLLYTKHNACQASLALMGSQMAQMLLEPVQNAVYRYLLGAMSGRKLFVHGTSRTLSATTRGRSVTFGVTDTAGGFISEEALDQRWSCLGAVFSRMGF